MPELATKADMDDLKLAIARQTRLVTMWVGGMMAGVVGLCMLAAFMLR